MRASLWIVAAVLVGGMGCGSCGSKAGSQDGGPGSGVGKDGGDGGSGVIPDAGCNFSGCTVAGTVPLGNYDGGPGAANGVLVGPTGVTLGGGVTFGRFAWIANHPEGWVAKYDTHATLANGQLSEVARYYSAIPLTPDGLSSYPDGGPLYVRATYPGRWGNCPSRTVLDLNGDMWVANRAPDLGLGSLTKIATNNTLDPATSGCVDRNHDGYIQTSADRNGNGIIDDQLWCRASEMNNAGLLPDGGVCEWIKPGNSPDAGDYDECVLFTDEVGSYDPASSTYATAGNGNNGNPFSSGNYKGRGLAVSNTVEGGTAGNIWLVHNHDHGVYAFNGDNGHALPIQTDGGNYVDVTIKGYGAIADRLGRLWVLHEPATSVQQLAMVNTADGTFQGTTAPMNAPTARFYGLGLDGQQRVWVTDWSGTSGSNTRAFRFTPGPGLDLTAGAWDIFDYSGSVSQIGTTSGRGRGIAIDNEGVVWMSMDAHNGGANMAAVIAFDSDGGGLRRFPKAGGGQADFLDVTSGAGSQYDSIPGLSPNVQASIGIALDYDNNVWVNNYGVGSGTVMRVQRDGGAVNFGPPALGAYYSYSDFTGYELSHYTAPHGAFTVVFNGCPEFADWNQLTFQDVIPAGTSMSVTVRTSNSTNFSTSAPFVWKAVDGANSINLKLPPGPVPQGTYMQVTFTLGTTNPGLTPTLTSVGYSTTCVPPGPN